MCVVCLRLCVGVRIGVLGGAWGVLCACLCTCVFVSISGQSVCLSVSNCLTMTFCLNCSLILCSNNLGLLNNYVFLKTARTSDKTYRGAFEVNQLSCLWS